MSAASVAIRAELIGALHRALTIAVEQGRIEGPEFDNVVALINKRDVAVIEEKSEQFRNSFAEQYSATLQPR